MTYDDEELRSVTLVPPTGRLTINGNVPTIVAGTCVAPDWYNDALDQSKLSGRDALRREIVFVACFLESYIYEWAQSELIHDVNFLIEKIPPYKANGEQARIPSLLPKWKQFPGVVFSKHGRVAPELDLSDLKTLIIYRDGLLHATVSKMYIANEGNLSYPEPSLLDLDKIQNGWALSVAVTLVKELHRQYGTPVPRYL